MVWRSDRARNVYNTCSLQRNDDPLILDGLNSEESSESEFVEEEKPWPPTEQRLSRSRAQKREARVPRPHSHLLLGPGGRSRGGRHARRWENSMFLTSLFSIPEEEFEASSTILPSHNTPLSQLHSSDKHMQIWYSFVARTEEEQMLTGPSLNPASQRYTSHHNPTEADHHLEVAPPTPEEGFKKVEFRIRSLLRHNSHIPMGLLSVLEEELRYLFSVSPHAIVLILQTNPFCRLLLHGVCQYMAIKSTTEHYQGQSVVTVECRNGLFAPPDTTLATHLVKSKS